MVKSVSSIELAEYLTAVVGREYQYWSTNLGGGFFDWVGVRYYVLTEVVSEKFAIHHPYIPSGRDVFNRAKRGLSSLIPLLFSWRRIRRAKYIFLLHERSKNYQDPYLADIVGTILAENDSSDVIIIGDSRSIPVNKDNFLSIEAVKVVSKIIAEVLVRACRLRCNRSEEERLSYLLGSAASNKVARLYKKKEWENKIERAIYCFMFSKSNLKKLILTVSYCNVPMIQAAKANNIDVFEMQHGLISKYHVGYSCGFNDNRSFPNAIGFFGQSWESELNLPNVNGLVIGNSRFESQVANKSDGEAQRSNVVLIISQPSVSSHIANEVKKIVEKVLDAEFIIKLHPAETLNHPYSEIVNKYEGVSICSAVDFNELLNSCGYIVGVYSTLLVELVQNKMAVNVISIPGAEKLPQSIGGCANIVERLDPANLKPMNECDCDFNFFEKYNEDVIKNWLLTEPKDTKAAA
jgi:hypothetical protein